VGADEAVLNTVREKKKKNPPKRNILQKNKNLTKDSSLLLHAIHSPFYCMTDFKENHTVFFTGFKNPHKKIRETKKLESIHKYVTCVLSPASEACEL
jgi:hypothetical protein